MSVTHALCPPPCSSTTPTARLVHSRSALTDSTNVNSHPGVWSPGYPKGLVHPTFSARTSCAWNYSESSTGSSCHAPHHLFSAPSLFPVTHKAPPTVSISLSAACSQSVPAERFCGSRTQDLAPDLPDVRSVVPFPSVPLDGDMDVDMLDGTCIPSPDNHFSSAGQAPRKRRSAHSSVSSSPSTVISDAKQKRPRKSRRQVTELWWLGVVHRSILRGIEVHDSVGELDASDIPLSGLRDFQAMDRVLVERIQKRLSDNGCVEGRALPNPLPRISSPTISVPSLNLLAPSRKALPVDFSTLTSQLNTQGNSTPTSPPTSKAIYSASSSITSSIPSSRSTSRRRHVRFEVPQRFCRAQPRLNSPRRSPSPPTRTGTFPTNNQMLTLTMPQLVASLTLAYRERSKLRLRARPYKTTECEDNAGHSPPSMLCQAVQGGGSDVIHREMVHQLVAMRARLSSAPERKSPLSRVAYAES